MERRIVKEDQEMVERLQSTFLPSKKVAAISAAIGTYMHAREGVMLWEIMIHAALRQKRSYIGHRIECFDEG